MHKGFPHIPTPPTDWDPLSELGGLVQQGIRKISPILPQDFQQPMSTAAATQLRQDYHDQIVGHGKRTLASLIASYGIPSLITGMVGLREWPIAPWLRKIASPRYVEDAGHWSLGLVGPPEEASDPGEELLDKILPYDPPEWPSLEQLGYTLRAEDPPSGQFQGYEPLQPVAAAEALQGAHAFGIFNTGDPVEKVGFVDVYRQGDELEVLEAFVSEELRGQGLGSAAYDEIEKVTGATMRPSSVLSWDGWRHWMKRDPEAAFEWLDEYANEPSYGDDMAAEEHLRNLGITSRAPYSSASEVWRATEMESPDYWTRLLSALGYEKFYPEDYPDAGPSQDAFGDPIQSSTLGYP